MVIILFWLLWLHLRYLCCHVLNERVGFNVGYYRSCSLSYSQGVRNAVERLVNICSNGNDFLRGFFLLLC